MLTPLRGQALGQRLCFRLTDLGLVKVHGITRRHRRLHRLPPGRRRSSRSARPRPHTGHERDARRRPRHENARTHAARGIDGPHSPPHPAGPPSEMGSKRWCQPGKRTATTSQKVTGPGINRRAWPCRYAWRQRWLCFPSWRPQMPNLRASILAFVPSLWRARRTGREHQLPRPASGRHVRFVMGGPGGCHQDW